MRYARSAAPSECPISDSQRHPSPKLAPPSPRPRLDWMPPDARFLVADDDPDVLKAAEVALARTGATIDTAGSLDQLLGLVAPARYDAVLLDMNFAPAARSGEEGLAGLAELRGAGPGALRGADDAPGAAWPWLSRACRGAVNFVLKPWRNDALVAAMTEAADLTACGCVRMPARSISAGHGAGGRSSGRWRSTTATSPTPPLRSALPDPRSIAGWRAMGSSRALPFAAGVAARAAVIAYPRPSPPSASLGGDTTTPPQRSCWASRSSSRWIWRGARRRPIGPSPSSSTACSPKATTGQDAGPARASWAPAPSTGRSIGSPGVRARPPAPASTLPGRADRHRVGLGAGGRR